jgi:hypothetical protein
MVADSFFDVLPKNAKIQAGTCADFGEPMKGKVVQWSGRM